MKKKKLKYVYEYEYGAGPLDPIYQPFHDVQIADRLCPSTSFINNYREHMDCVPSTSIINKHIFAYYRCCFVFVLLIFIIVL